MFGSFALIPLMYIYSTRNKLKAYEWMISKMCNFFINSLLSICITPLIFSFFFSIVSELHSSFKVSILQVTNQVPSNLPSFTLDEWCDNGLLYLALSWWNHWFLSTENMILVLWEQILCDVYFSCIQQMNGFEPLI